MEDALQVFGLCCSVGEMRFLIIRWVLNADKWCSSKRPMVRREESCVKMVTEMGMRQGSQGTSGTTSSGQRQGRITPRAFGGSAT